MPMVGYGTWQSTDADLLKASVKDAVRAGYRHIDSAAFYENEHIIGEALEELYDEQVVKREDLFLTTKTLPSYHRRELVPECLQESLNKLRTTYIDLYLIHFPVAYRYVEDQPLLPMGRDGKVMIDVDTRIEETWAGLEDCVEQGLARSIGLANTNIGQIERILNVCKIKPAVNQVESHPAFQNTKMLKFLERNEIAMTAYSQFGSPGTVLPYNNNGGKAMCDLKLLEDPRLVEIASKYGKKPSNVILKWQMQRKVFVIPKSTTRDRIRDNFRVWDFTLSDGDMKAIGDMDLDARCLWLDLPGMLDHPDYPHSKDGRSC